MTVRVSVVVPTYHRPMLLDQCLDALARQDFPASDYEVIVADAANDEATRQQVEGWNRSQGFKRSAPVFTYVPVLGKNHGPAAARNAGWRLAQGKIIAFTDDDCIPASDWLRAGARVFVDGVKGASGQVVVPLPEHPTDYEINEARLSGAEFVTANCFIRRSELEAIGGFDERFESAWREDSDLYFTLLEHKGNLDRIVSVPGSVVFHPIRPAGWGVSLRQQKKSMYNALLHKKHPRLYRQSESMAPPWHYYGILLSLVGLLIGVLLGRKKISWFFAGLWLALTGRFAARRLKNTSHLPARVAETILTSCLIPPLSIFWRLVGAVRYRTPFI